MSTSLSVPLRLCAFASTLLAASPAAGGDWPQILGPNRNGIAGDEKIVNSFPAGGPKVVWQRKVGDGFSGIAVADGVAVLFHRDGRKEIVDGLNAKTGKPLWSAKHDTSYTTGFSSDQGPRCTPVIHKQHVYVYGAQGVLRCIKLKSGAVVWTRETHKDFGAHEGYFGAGSTPIVEGDNLLVNVGSRRGAAIVAFDLKTGKTAWRSFSDTASYSSPVAVTVNGTRHVIFITRLNLVSLDPKTGKVRFSFRFGARGPTVNGASPVVVNGHLFATAHYGVGAVYAKIGKAKADVQWKSDAIMSSQYMTSIPHDRHLFGIHGQERVGLSELRCFDPKTKKIAWSKRRFGYGTLIKADGKFLAVTTTGELILFKADAKKYSEWGRATIFDSTTRALPALAGGLLYARDTGTLKCLDLRRK